MTGEKNLASVCNSHWFNVTLALDVNYYSNAPVNIMPHYPLYGHRWGKTGDFWGN